VSSVALTVSQPMRSKSFLSLAAFAVCVLSILAAPQSSAQNTISTYAGGGAITGAASSIDLAGPTAAIRDGAGNTYVTAPYSAYILKLNSGTASTFAGTGYEGFGGDGGPVSGAVLGLPSGLTIDGKGNIYISDPGNSRVRMVTPAGTISTVVGSGGKCEPSTKTCGDGGLALNASLNVPLNVALDSTGNIYVADASDHRIRAVNMQAAAITVFGVTIQPGNIATVAGNGTMCNNPVNACGDGGLATAANLNYPESVGGDTAGNLYIADTHDNRIRMVNASTGIITSVVGVGKSCLTPTGSCGDGGPASRANLSFPSSMFLDSSNNIYIVDSWDHKVRFVNMGTTTLTVFGVAVKAGNIGTVAGIGSAGFTGDNGPAKSAQLNFPDNVSLDSTGNLLIGDTGNQRIRQIDTTGTITTIAGGGMGGDGGAATNGVLVNPYNVAEDSAGNVYVADTANNRIRMITPAGIISTVAGTGIAGHTGDGGPAISATLNAPTQVAVDSANNLWIADNGNLAIRRVDGGTGIITRYAGTYGSACRGGGPGTCGDGGAATSATFTTPQSVAVDTAGNVYIADYNAFRVREVLASTGIINTIAGNGGAGQMCPTTPFPALQKPINHPSSVAVDSAGNVYVDNSFANSICKVSGGMISQYAFNGNPTYKGDGGPALNASQFFPLEIALDPAGNLYVGGGDYNCVRRVDALTYTIGTVAGDVAASCVGGYAGDGGPATSAKISNLGLAVDGNENLYIADAGNNRIRLVHLTPAEVNTTPPNFGAFPIGTTSPAQTLTITSNGGVDLNLSAFSIAGADPTDFTQTATTCGTLPANIGVDASCTVTLTFTPQTFGLRTATFQISDNGPNTPQSVTLSGYGPYFNVNASPSTLTIPRGTQQTSTLTIAPVAGFNQTVTLTSTGCNNGLTCTISPSSVTLDGVHSATATMTMQVSSTAPTGNRNITATGTFGPLQMVVRMKVTIQ